MIILLALAAVLIFTIGFVAGRLLRPSGSGLTLTPAWWAALGCAGILLVGSAVLYAFLTTPSGGKSPGISPAEASAASADTPLIRVKVEVAPALRPRAPSAAALFVFVRDAAQGGPPLAVKRLQSRFPQTVELTSADAMIPGHAITAGEHVKVIARISPSGDAMDKSGDLSGQADYRVGRNSLVDVVIDRVTP